MTHVRHRILWLTFFWAGAAHAQTAQPLNVIVYPSSVISIDNRAEAEGALRKVPGNASIIDQRLWQGQRAATLKDITDYTPGIYTQPRNGAESSKLSLRGSGLANNFQGRGLLVLQDGIPINMADGEFEFPVIDPWLIDYVRVMPGANALADGASTLGGAIDFVTLNGGTSEGTGVKTEAGSFGTVHGFLSHGETWQAGDAFASAADFHQNGFRENNRQDTRRFNGNAGWSSQRDFSNRLYISHTASDAQIPGAVSAAQTAEDSKRANPNNVAGHYRRDLDITRIAHKSSWRRDGQSLDTALFYTYRTLDNPVTTYIREDNNDGGGRIKYTKTLGLDQFTSGLNLSYGTQDETRYANIAGQEGARILDRDLHALSSELYGQYEHYLTGGLYAVGSVQGSYSTRNIREITPARQEQNEEYSGINPRIGARYDLNPDTQVYANLSRSYEPPTWAELSGGNAPGFNKLKAQKATTAEIGGRGAWNKIAWSASLYHSLLNNEFVNYKFADGTTDTINLNKSVHDGLELGLNGRAAHDFLAKGDSVDLKGAYTYSRFKLDGDPLYGDNQVPGMPEHYIRVEMIYRHPSGVSLGPNIEWSPSAYPVDITNSLDAKPYAILGARIQWQKEGQDAVFYIDGRNLLNRRYAATVNVIPDAGGADGRYFYPGEGRAVFAGMSFKF